jgi:Protein of unknown function (DUF3352)
VKAKSLAVILVVAVVAAATSYFAVNAFFGPAEDSAVELVPEDAFVYANAWLDPSRNQKRAIRDLLEKFERAPTPDDAVNALVDLIDEGLAEVGLTFEADVDPWLGRQVAFYASDVDSSVPTLAALVETTDTGATQDMIDEVAARRDLEPQERTYEGVDYQFYAEEQLATGFIGDFWVVATEGGFEASVDASEGQSLADNDRFDRSTDRLTDDHLALFYFDSARLVEIARESGDLTAEDLEVFSTTGLGEQEPTAGIFAATDDSLFFEVASPVPEQVGSLLGSVRAPGLIPELPGDSWFAFGAADIGDTVNDFLQAMAQADTPGIDIGLIEEQLAIETGLDLQDDLLSWMGDVAVFVEGTGLLTLGGGLVIETTDPSVSAATVQKFGEYLAANGAPIVPAEVSGYEGFAIQIPGAPQPVNVLAGDEKVVAAYGSAATNDAIEPPVPLADSEAFERAADSLGTGYDASFWIDIDAITTLIEGVGAASDPTYTEEVKPWLDPLSHIVSGTKLDGDIVVQKVVIGAQ